MLPDIENPFFTQMAGVIEKVADTNGYRVILCNTGDDFEKEKTALQMPDVSDYDDSCKAAYLI